MSKKTKKIEASAASQNNNQVSYEAKDIYVLEGLEPVRKRPGMYVGSTGTDGLHHLIWEVTDNSLTYNTPVIIKEDGKVCLRKIGEAIDSVFERNNRATVNPALQNYIGENHAEILRDGFNIQALSFNPETLRLSWVPVSSLIRHKVNSEIFEITLQNNRKIQITPYHSLFTLCEGQVVPIKGSELKVGSYVVAPKNFPEPDHILGINLFEELFRLDRVETERINLYSMRQFLTEEIKPFVKKYCIERGLQKKENGYWWSNIFSDYRRFDYLPFNIIREFPPEIRARFGACLLGNKRRDSFKLKPILPVTRELVELLGLYSAEGTVITSKATNRVVFSFGSHEEELTAYTAQLIKKVFGYRTKIHYSHETANTIQIDSFLVSLIFKKIFGTGINSHSKKIPSLIFNVPVEHRERYLVAYMAGDGCPSKDFVKHLIDNTSPGFDSRRKFTAVSASSEFIDGLSYLLFSLGKSFSVGETHSERNGDIKISYHGKIRSTAFAKGRILNSKRLDFYWNTNSSYLDRVPVEDVISQISWKRPHTFSVDTRGGITREKICVLLEQNRIALFEHSPRFLDSDLGILKVVRVEKIPYDHQWVYDFSVPDGENFVAGFSPIVVHNSIDEAMAGFAKNIVVELLPDNKVSIIDDGRGIPVEMHHQTKKSALETVMTTLHAGGKFGGESYKVAGGLHGVGVSVVNALSEWLRVEVCRNGNLYAQEYERGNPKTKVKKIGTCKQTGTKVIFSPDPQVFSEIHFNDKRIIEHLRQQAYLTKGVRINFLDRRLKVPHFYGFCFDGGLLSFVKYLAGHEKPLHEEIFYVHRNYEKIEVEAAFLYVDDVTTEELSFANNIYTPDGGMHLTGFRSALTRSLNSYARAENYLKEKEENLASDDTREGLIAVVSVKLREPQFEGQTKARLGNPEARTAAETVINEALKEFLEKRPSDARRMIEKVLLTAKARRAARAAKETVLRKGAFEGLTLPGKLADCTSRRPEDSELFIVEGDSAGGSAKQGRDRQTQAILPLKGKILNVEKARLDKIMVNQEIRSLIVAIGTAIAEEFDLSKLRYHKIILMSDADVDGAHIRTLLLTFFYRYFRQIIEEGYVYIAQPPLYRIQAGKEIRYAFSDAAKEKIVAELQKSRLASKKTEKIESIEETEVAAEEVEKKTAVNVQRYKGLGEMSPVQLWETTMNPLNRILKQVTIEDAEEADRLFDILMGDEVEPRKKFIQAHAAAVQNLDV